MGCRQKDGVGFCDGKWKCVKPDDECEAACIQCNQRNNDICYQNEVNEDSCAQCRQKDGVGLCDGKWKCVKPDDECEAACIQCNQRNNDICYQNEVNEDS